MPISEAYNVDCLEYMKTLPDKYFDLAIADPPYWAPEEQTGRIRTTGDVQSSLELGAKPSDLFFEELQRVSRSQIIWGANNFGIPFKGFIVWDKTNIPDEFTLSKCEIASVSENLSRVAKVFRAPSTVTGLKRIHPTQKPIALYAWILKTYATPPSEFSTPCSEVSRRGSPRTSSASTSTAANSTRSSSGRATSASGPSVWARWSCREGAR